MNGVNLHKNKRPFRLPHQQVSRDWPTFYNSCTRYAIPLVISSGLMHWLVSQSIFLAHITVLTNRGIEDPGADITTCGYSCIASFSSSFIGSLMVLTVITTGFRRLNARIPLASSYSIAISAACHPPQDRCECRHPTGDVRGGGEEESKHWTLHLQQYGGYFTGEGLTVCWVGWPYQWRKIHCSWFWMSAIMDGVQSWV